MTTSIENAPTPESLAAYPTTEQQFNEMFNSRDATWVSEVKRHALMISDKEAVEYDGVVHTWSELRDRVEDLARGLALRGLEKGDRAIIASGNSIAMLEFMIAVHQVGAIAVPMNFRLTQGEFAWGLDNADAKMILSDRVTLPVVEQALKEYRDDYNGHPVLHITQTESDAHGTVLIDALQREGAEGQDVVFPAVPARTPGFIMYTSGTTGRPKGAVITHQNMFAQVLIVTNAYRDFDDDATMMLSTPLFHSAGLAFVKACVSVGAKLIIKDSYGFDPTELAAEVAEKQVDTLFLVPTQWQMLCNSVRESSADTSCLRNLGWGAAPASESLLKEMGSLFPNANIVAFFGQTEMSPIACVLPGRHATWKIGSVGKPASQVSVRIVDDKMNDVPQGEVGEIVYRGPGVMLEYWKNEQKTKEAFAGGWFHSGDLVYKDPDGFLYVVDRAKDMIISGGENIYCVEVENCLGDHPKVREIAVIGRPSEKWGETPVAVVALEDGVDSLELDDLNSQAEGNLARFKHPKELIIVDSLPRNTSGKVQKHLLRDEHFGV